MNDPNTIDRREFFNWGIRGIGATAFASLLSRGSSARASSLGPAVFPNFEPRAKRAIHISLVGGMSHIDSYDHKPGLDKAHGKPLGSSEKPDIFFGKVGLLRKSDFQFKPRSQSGLWLSDMFPHIAGMADEMTVIRSMTTDSANHTPALFSPIAALSLTDFRRSAAGHRTGWAAILNHCQRSSCLATDVVGQTVGRLTGPAGFFRRSIRGSSCGAATRRCGISSRPSSSLKDRTPPRVHSCKN